MERYKSKERHIRWNWEISPDMENAVRYHLIVVDDKDRDVKMLQILESFISSGINYPFEKVRFVEDKVEGTRFRYLFESYDSLYLPTNIKFSSKNVKRDNHLKERVRGTIEDYVGELYRIRK